MAGYRGEVPNLTVKALLERYDREVAAHKKGRRWESIRLTALGRDRLAVVRLRQLDTPHMAEWQERRLRDVSGASVRRERNLLNHAFEIARKEWKWLARNPFEGVRRPKDSRSRKRTATPAEIQKLTRRASDKLRGVILWALETGMRAGEIASLTEIKGNVAHVDGKTGEREVPLSGKALEVWQEGGFGLTAGSISGLFARLCADCEIEGLTFHDLRRTATVRLAPKLSPLELAKMLGHRDLRMTLNVYYKIDTAEVAKKLG